MKAKAITPINSDPGQVRSASRPVSIDVHHHFNPALKDNEGNFWSVEMTLEEMDRNAISTAVASLGPVNDSVRDQRPRRVRDWNEWGTKTCQDHPGRFGLFASLPLPDVDLALTEICYVYDVLHADGIGLSTNEGDIWLGDERNAPKVLFPDGVYVELGKLYFECAQAYAPETMDLLLRVVSPSHLLFGSDFSYFPIAHSREAFSSLQPDADVTKAIGGGNAAALFPQIRILE